MLTLLLLAALIVSACASPAPPSPPPPPPTFNPATEVEDLKARLESRAEHNKLVLDDELTAWFIPCEPTPATWAAPIIVFHMPSASSIHLNNDGSVMDNIQPRYKSEAGPERLEALLENDDVIEKRVSTYPKSLRCPPEFR